MKISRLFACLLALCSFGCGDDSPTAPTNLPGTPITELFIGTLPVGGSSFYSIGFPETTTVRVTLIALSSADRRAHAGHASAFVWACPAARRARRPTRRTSLRRSRSRSPPSSPPAPTVSASPTRASLTQPTNFLIRINQIPASSRPPIAATPSTETFASNLALRGTSARTFAATGNGQVTVSDPEPRGVGRAGRSWTRDPAI